MNERLKRAVELRLGLSPAEETAAIASGRSSTEVQDKPSTDEIRKNELIQRLLGPK